MLGGETFGIAGTLACLLTGFHMGNYEKPWGWICAVAWVLGCVAASLAACTKPGWTRVLFAELASLYVVGPILGLWVLYALTQGHAVDPTDYLRFWAPGDGFKAASMVLLPIVPLWAGDSAAIFAGKAFGKHLLAPKVSPKKTWEGAIANLVSCILAGWGLGVAVGLPWAVSIVCGALCGTFGQAGDLFESWLKRRAEVKDSGGILPGHGGLLDRIDSLLFSTIPVLLVISLWRGSP